MMMSGGGGSRLGSSMFAVAGRRYLSTATARSGTFSIEGVVGVRCKSTLALGDDKGQQRQGEKQAARSCPPKDHDQKELISYWGLKPTKVTKEDGAEWKWSCFRVQNLFINI